MVFKQRSPTVLQITQVQDVQGKPMMAAVAAAVAVDLTQMVAVVVPVDKLLTEQLESVLVMEAIEEAIGGALVHYQ